MGIMEIFKKKAKTTEFYAVACEWQYIINADHGILTLALLNTWFFKNNFITL
jgi:hypothetical protein